MTACSTPCPTCPWRRSSTTGGADILGFDAEKMRHLRHTVGPDDDFRPVMACHGSAEDAARSCVGYLAVEGYRNLNVRMMAIRGEVDLPAVWAGCDGLDLFGGFHEMLDAYEEVWADG